MATMHVEYFIYNKLIDKEIFHPHIFWHNICEIFIGISIYINLQSYDNEDAYVLKTEKSTL